MPAAGSPGRHPTQRINKHASLSRRSGLIDGSTYFFPCAVCSHRLFIDALIRAWATLFLPWCCEFMLFNLSSEFGASDKAAGPHRSTWIQSEFYRVDPDQLFLIIQRYVSSSRDNWPCMICDSPTLRHYWMFSWAGYVLCRDRHFAIVKNIGCSGVSHNEQ